jgi:hypothetical protein
LIRGPDSAPAVRAIRADTPVAVTLVFIDDVPSVQAINTEPRAFAPDSAESAY